MDQTIALSVAQQLLQIKAIKLSPQNPFTWASGMRSPIYCDNRVALSHPAVRNLLIKGFQEASGVFGPVDVVAGVATAGIPHGAILADKLGLPFVYVREKAKSHGRQNQIEGELSPGARVLVIEDLISTGGSSLKAVEALREAGAVVAGVLAVFTYGLPASEHAFSEAQCPHLALSDFETLLKAAIEAHYLNAESLDTLSAWSKSPQAWSENWLAAYEAK
jgi:orotate phosphoribosyltransferase